MNVRLGCVWLGLRTNVLKRRFTEWYRSVIWRKTMFITRRGFIASSFVLTNTAFSAAASKEQTIKLGFDNFAVRAMQWNARELVDHAVALGCNSVFITDFGPFEDRLDDSSLREIRHYGMDKEIDIVLGSWSICPSSKTFKADWGTAYDHLVLGIRMAKALGSPAFRVTLGNSSDRLTKGGIEARIADTVQVLKQVRNQAIDAGVKIAVENHAGDMQSRELKHLVEEAGPDFVGVNFDSGNACWTLENPVQALLNLAPYVLTTSLRDTMIWESENGITTQWTAMGEGCVDFKTFFKIFRTQCPDVTVHIETISGFPKSFPIYEHDFWNLFPNALAKDFSAFLTLAKKGNPIPTFRPAAKDKLQAKKIHQISELERSILYCKNVLGLGS